MDYSMQAYMRRLPTEKLVSFLQQCRDPEQKETYAYLIPEIEKLLQQRMSGQQSGGQLQQADE